MAKHAGDRQKGGGARGQEVPVRGEVDSRQPLASGPHDSEILTQVRGKTHMYEGIADLPFRVRTGPSTAFDHRTKPGTVILGVLQLERLEVTDPDVIDFIVIHELGHFFELSQDPQGFRTVIDEAKRDDGLGQAYFRFYNALMDIYVNHNTMNRAPQYRDAHGDYTDEIKRLYTEKLFPKRDLTELPLSTQYSYALLNIGMHVGDDLVVSPEVQEALDKSFMRYGEEFTTQEIIETYLIPAIGVQSTKEWRATISERKGIIDATFRKRFEELIQVDQQNEQDPNQGMPDGDLEGFEASPDDLRRATEQAEAIQHQNNKSDEEKAADSRTEAVQEEAEKHLSPDEARDFAETYRRVYPQIVEVAQILKEIVRQEIDYRQETLGHFREGIEPDMEEVVEQFPTIVRNPSQAKVMLKDVYQEVIVEQPQHVRLWPILDLSGSMEDDISLVRDLCVVFSGAAQSITLEAELGQHQLRTSLGVTGYNNEAFEIVPLTESPTYADIAKGYSKLRATGGTYEAPALNKVARQIRRLERGENVVDIVLVVTDGETSVEGESITAIAKLKGLGAKLLAFQFSRGYLVPDQKTERKDSHGVGSFQYELKRPEPESGTFGRIWRENGYVIRGTYSVVPAVRDGLRELLTKGEVL